MADQNHEEVVDQVQKKLKPNELITTVNTEKAPKAVGPYTQGKIVAAGAKLFYASGQIPINPETNTFDETSDIVSQTEQVLKNLTAVLHAAGTDLEYVVKVNIFLDDMDNFAKVNEVYGKYFTGDNKPARACVAVKTLPKNAKVEIECVAVVP
ncbi:hypothetical protein ABPG74_018370 [Tetrahymena malaccensis]